MSSIPDEVIFEILCHLPVKSLLRFKCVCKSWQSLIDSPSFVKMHLNRSLELKSGDTNAKLILSGDSSIRSVSFDSLSIHMDAHSISINYPLTYDDSPTLVMGYCNGLLLISCGLDFALWNPSTRKYYKLPFFEMKQPLRGRICCQYHGGFGFDQTTHDYKVVRILQAANSEKSCGETIIYSLKSDSWRRVKEFPLWICQDTGGIFALGALHWVGYMPSETDDEYMVVAFDLGSEEYDLVPLPLHLDVPYLVDIGVLDGCLSMSCNYRGDYIDIWLLKERGKRDSWIKLLSLSRAAINWSLKRNVKPITYSRCGKYVILEKDEEQLLFYDLELKVVKRTWSHVPSTFCTFLYLGSLVQLKGTGAAEVSKNKDQAQKKPKKRDDVLSKGFKLKL